MEVTEALPEVVEKIHSTGYWRVNIRPALFDSTRIPSLSACREIIEKCSVSLTGWHYPHIDPDGMLNGQDWVESNTDWLHFVEYWRFYQSSQFIHHRAFWEDYKYGRGKVLELWHTLYTLTEIFEFAGRLAERQLLSPVCEISIDLHGMKGRVLIQPDFPFFGVVERYVSNLEKISFSQRLKEEDILSQRHEFALDAAMHFLERFNWREPPRQMFAEQQRKLLERRL